MKRTTFIILSIFIIVITCGVWISVKKRPATFSRDRSLSLQEAMDKGNRHYRNNHPDSALLQFLRVAENYDSELPDSVRQQCVKAMNIAGAIYNFDYLDFKAAYEYTSRALDIAEQNGWTELEPSICLNMAAMFMMYRRYLNMEVASDNIMKYTRQGFDNAYDCGQYPIMAASLMNLLKYDLSMPVDSFKAIFNKDIPENARGVKQARNLVNASLLLKARRFDEARSEIMENDERKYFTDERDRERAKVSTQALIAMTYIAEKNYEDAERLLCKSLALSDSLGFMNLKFRTLYDLSSLPEGRGEKYTMQYLLEKDRVLSSGRLAIIGELDFLRKLKKEQENSIRHERNEKRLVTILIVVLTALIVISAFIVYIMRQRSKLYIANKALYNRIQSQIAASGGIAKGSAENIIIDSETEPGSERSHKRSSSLTPEKSENIYADIVRVLEDKESICNPDLTLSRLASSINVNTVYVSRVINERFNISFSSLINQLRINLACERMNDIKNYGNLTIDAISKSVGFTSRSSFINAFKKLNGMTPSEYLRIVKKNISEYPPANN